MFSLIQTALENGLDPYNYLTWLLKQAKDSDLTDTETVKNFCPGIRRQSAKQGKEKNMRLDRPDAELFTNYGFHCWIL